jgi:RsiW-degrading membrane proteinase PrsW (M82 family)
MALVFMILVLVLAIGIGMALNVFSGVSRGTDAKEGTTPLQVLGATALLGAFIIALVLSGSATSYSSASKAAKQEADIVDTIYESAEYVDQPFRQDLQASAVCYARAVVGPEWETLAEGKSSPVPTNWTGIGPHGIRKTLIAMGTTAKGFSLIQSADAKRGELRTERVTQANATVPEVLFWLMILLIALTLGGLAYSIPRKNNTGQIVCLVIVSLFFVTVVLLIRNLDRPFSSVLALKPTAMTGTAQEIGREYVAAYQVQPPCNDLGEPR